MKKKLLFLIPFLFFVVGILCFFLFREPGISKAEQTYRKIISGLDGAAEPQSTTRVMTFDFSDGEHEMSLHIYQTYYYVDDILISGVNYDAISGLFDTSDPVLEKEFGVYGYPAAIYRGDVNSYLCWTSDPTVSGVLEYKTGTISEDELMKIVKSVYRNLKDEK